MTKAEGFTSDTHPFIWEWSVCRGRRCWTGTCSAGRGTHQVWPLRPWRLHGPWQRTSCRQLGRLSNDGRASWSKSQRTPPRWCSLSRDSRPWRQGTWQQCPSSPWGGHCRGTLLPWRRRIWPLVESGSRRMGPGEQNEIIVHRVNCHKMSRSL